MESPSDIEPISARPVDRMQRVRVGVTGLAAVVLIILLATAIASGVRRTASNTGNLVEPPVAGNASAAGNVDDSQSEPLAQLGAAPGSKTESVDRKPAKH